MEKPSSRLQGEVVLRRALSLEMFSSPLITDVVRTVGMFEVVVGKYAQWEKTHTSQ